jgi:hypothetical protein
VVFRGRRVDMKLHEFRPARIKKSVTTKRRATKD